MITNNQLKKSAGQVFAFGNQYESPFFNRDISKKELRKKSKNFKPGSAFIISEPLGTGKTFFIDSFSKELGTVGKFTPSYPKTFSLKKLARQKNNEFIFLDEVDIKTPYEKLSEVLEILCSNIRETGQKLILIGDYSLRNPDLTDRFEYLDLMETFEPLDQEFLKGVINSRLGRYLKKNEEIIQPDLMDLIIPQGMRPSASFRALLTMFAGMMHLLPSNSDPCRLNVNIARNWADQNPPLFENQRQVDFLDLLLDYLADSHPNGSGLGQGFNIADLYHLAADLPSKFTDIEEFEQEILVPFTRQELLISMGVPYLSDDGRFIRRPEPFLPSVQMLLLV